MFCRWSVLFQTSVCLTTSSSLSAVQSASALEQGSIVSRPKAACGLMFRMEQKASDVTIMAFIEPLGETVNIKPLFSHTNLY